jgi:hypothetical protein
VKVFIFHCDGEPEFLLTTNEELVKGLAADGYIPVSIWDLDEKATMIVSIEVGP